MSTKTGTPQDAIAGFRLSPQQARLWPLHRDDPSTYKSLCTVVIDGCTSLSALHEAVRRIVARHEILRTTFHSLPGMALPVQVVGENDGFAWEAIDFSGLDDDAKAAALSDRFAAAVRQPFDAVAGPLLTVFAAKLSPDRHALMIGCPALCADAASLSVLASEIGPASIPEHIVEPSEPVQYADYAEWANERVEAVEAARDSAAPATLSNDAPAAAVFVPEYVSRSVAADVQRRIEQAAASLGAPIEAVLLACWQVLLIRLAESRSVCVLDEGRDDDTALAIGLFERYLTLEIDVDDDVPLRDLIAGSAEQVQEARRAADAAVGRRTPAVPRFAFDHRQRRVARATGTPTVSVREVYACSQRSSLRLCCIDASALQLHYDPSAYDRDEVERLADRYLLVVQRALADVDAGISSLDVTFPQERHQLLSEFAGRSLAYDASRTVVDLFEEQAGLAADKAAVRCGDCELTYAQLDARATQWAGALRAHGVGPEVLVGLWVDRSVDALVAILAIWKAGGAYVPLDPSYPRERVAFMLGDAKPTVILTVPRVVEQLPPTTIPIVCLDDATAQLETVSRDEVHSTLPANRLAYVMYTSGSTGEPKGVMITHANLCHYVHALQASVKLDATDRYLHTASFAFSSSVRQTLLPLTCGATLVVAMPEDIRAPLTLFEQIRRSEITVIDIVPTYWRTCNQILRRLDTAARETVLENRLRLILSASEPLTRDIPNQWATEFGHSASVINMYGQTETAGIVAVHPVHANDGDAGGRVPVGRPIANTRIYILNSQMQPAPVGVFGEVCVAGPSVGRGYHNHVELTAQKFTRDPFGSGPDARLYKTGDLGRYRADGTIELRGRIDSQIKVRGFRVEPTEVEAACRQHPAVLQVVVVAEQDVAHGGRLAAFIVQSPNGRVAPGELLRYLREKLPEYAVPSTIELIDKLPLTDTGKIDRRALRSLVGREPAVQKRRELTAPATPTEEKLIAIWAELLGTDDISIDDNFFEIGGQSLLAAQMLSRIREMVHVDLPWRRLFEAPTVAALATTIDRMLESTIARDDAQPQSDDTVPIPRRRPDDRVPLSPTQEQMWFIDQLTPGSASYNMAYAFKLRGPLSVAALERSFNEIVRRHESLRTTFVSVEGVPTQVIAPSLTIALPVITAPSDSGLGSTDAAIRLANEHARQPFDLAKGPLLRCRLFEVSAEEHVLLIAMHHIVGDGWSWTVLLSELSALYAAYSEERQSSLPELSIQYGDFARWQSERLRQDVLATRVEYWSRHLENAPTLLDLPTDHPRGAAQSFRGVVHSETLPLELKERLEALSQRHGATLFMTLCAAFNALLFRWTGQEDIVVGSTIAARNRPSLEPLIGLFINTLVLRTDLSGNPTFGELLQRLREVALGAYVNHEVAFDKIIERLHSKRGLSHSTLFQVLFVMHHGTAQQDLSLAGLRVDKIPVETGAVKFDLSVSIVDRPDGLNCNIAYQTDLFDAATIRRLTAQFQRILRAVAQDPALRLSQLPLLSEAEHHEMLVTWNDTQKAYPAEATIPELFEQQVARTPDACAVVCGEAALTYRELSTKAAEAADRLYEAGVRPGACVALCVDRSLDMLVGLFAVWKAGCTYVPLDPQYALERLAWVVRDTGSPVLLTARRLAHTLATIREACADLVVLYLDDPDAGGTRRPQTRARVPVSPDDLAYVIYTSGSTGTPKGVEITHRSVVNFALASAESFALRPADRVLQFASFSFDTAVEEIFPCLITGATLVLRNDEMLSSASAFLRQCGTWQITVLDLPTVYWHELTAEIAAQKLELPEALRLVILGGDRALPERAEQWLNASRGRGIRLLNEYGPTEATVVATTYEVTGAASESHQVPIGRPIANVQTYILDRALNPVAIGARGELYIGGVGLARGYRHRPELTAEYFVPNPFSGVLGDRLYKTGDFARYLPDGSIEFLGRADHQVKVRGFRVEPGEIEAVLTEHPAVRQVVVVAQQDHLADHRLIAYVVPASDAQPDAQGMRDFLKGRVPQYMVPSAFVFLDALPLTTHGKVDRTALPDVGPDGAESPNAFVAARTPLERELVQHWEALLSKRPIGVDDNFFDLGGHSLLAVRVLSRIRRDVGVDLPMRVLFEQPTVAGIAAAIAASSGAAPATPATPECGAALPEAAPTQRIPRRNADGPVPLSSTQEQLWFIDQLSPGSASYNLAAAFRLRGALNLEALGRAFDEIVRRHESVRTIFESVDGVPAQVVVAPRTPTLSVVENTAEPGAAASDGVIRLAEEHARQPFDLAKDLLLRCRLFEVSGEEHVLLIAMHHIVSDGWSWGVLLAELSTLYEAFSQQRPANLPELTLQYGDFARWESERLGSGVLDQRLEYWTRQLANAPKILELPTDRARPAVQSFRGAVHTETFPLHLKTQLEVLSRKEGATLFMTLCAAFNALLFRWTGQEDIVVGSTIAVRNRPELEPLIGLFISILVLRTDLSGDPTFHDLLRRVREVALDAYANQEAPFTKVIEQLQATRSLSHGTLFQTMFILHQGTAQQDLALAGMTVERVPVELGAVKFDLTVSMVDKPDGLTCAVTYQTDLFDAATIRRLVAQFQTLLCAIAQDPQIRLSRLPLIPEAERHEMLVTWNDTQKAYPAEATIPELFEQQVARTPDACAVVCGEAALTYRELSTKAAEAADRLYEAGVRPGACVALCVDRSLDMLVGLFAVWKAGCTYVPLDPQYALERLAWVVRDTGSPVLLTARRLAHTLAHIREELADLVVICLDEPDAGGTRRPQTRARVPVSPDDLAYVIYTSGSTGTPKGVEITHRSVVNFALASAESFALRPADRVLQFASFSFDTAVEEIFPCLITGATLVLRNDEMLHSASAFLRQCRTWQITVLDLPTVYWHELTADIAANRLELPEALRLVIVGGDRALPERAEQWLKASSGRGIRLLNGYGPTEATVVATTYEVTGASESRQVPIGRPIANVQTYILDRALNPVAIGARGELYIGGVGLARGYRHRPDLTADNFVPNPFSRTPGERLYRTGDFARYLPDGSIEFLGRTDHQAKVRGFRVEPGEIEAVLAEHPAIRQVVVVARPDPVGDHRLIAYAVPASGAQPQPQSLRDFLKGRVPPYMVPSAFVFLDALPLTIHGKVDRQALPDVGPDDAESLNAFVAARTPLERELVQEWEALLSKRPIGIRDNFFDLGGHSLLGVRLIARIEERLGRPMPVAVLFEAPTIEQLALRLDRRTPSESWSSLLALQPNGSKLPFFWAHGDLSFAMLPRYLGPDQPLYGLEHQSQDGQPARYTRVEDIAAHYLREVRSAQRRGPYRLGGFSFGAVVAFEMAQQLQKAGEIVELLFLLDPPWRQSLEYPSVGGRLQLAFRDKSRRRHFSWARIRDYVEDVYDEFKAEFIKRLNTRRIRRYVSAQRPLPPSLRSRYILDVYAEALREYVPQRYSGSVTLVKKGDAPYKPRLDWVNLVAGGPRILQLTGGHKDLTTELLVGQWAPWLKESLNQVGSRIGASPLTNMEGGDS